MSTSGGFGAQHVYVCVRVCVRVCVCVCVCVHASNIKIVMKVASSYSLTCCLCKSYVIVYASVTDYLVT